MLLRSIAPSAGLSSICTYVLLLLGLTVQALLLKNLEERQKLVRCLVRKCVMKMHPYIQHET